MTYLEFKDGTSHKFWQIELEGSAFTVTFGRIGTAGQAKTTTCESPESHQGARQAGGREDPQGLWRWPRPAEEDLATPGRELRRRGRRQDSPCQDGSLPGQRRRRHHGLVGAGLVGRAPRELSASSLGRAVRKPRERPSSPTWWWAPWTPRSARSPGSSKPTSRACSRLSCIGKSTHPRLQQPGLVHHPHFPCQPSYAGDPLRGMPKEVLACVAQAKLPKLEHMELYLGMEDYGFDGSIEDVRPFFAKGLFPSLKYLGLSDSCIADEVATGVATSPVLEQIEVLDLSQGTLTDVGGRALLDSPLVKGLKKLDLHYHYLSTDLMKEFKASGLNVDVSDQQKGDEDDDQTYRYPAVGE
ncbi:MAG: WGR domain-containing protein [Fibrobacteres bacterium]|nr:WGR domain-containing protein [Fibrobacterota bacterium]